MSDRPGRPVLRALDDEYLHARLLALTADASPSSGSRFRQLEPAFDVAVDPGGFVAWNEAYGFAQALEQVIGAVEQRVAVLAGDHSSAHRYLLIAEELLAAGRSNEATEWAACGLAAFPQRPDSRLLDFVCDRYSESGRHEEARLGDARSSAEARGVPAARQRRRMRRRLGLVA